LGKVENIYTILQQFYSGKMMHPWSSSRGRNTSYSYSQEIMYHISSESPEFCRRYY